MLCSVTMLKILSENSMQKGLLRVHTPITVLTLNLFFILLLNKQGIFLVFIVTLF